MNKQMLKVIGVVILSNLILSFMIIYYIKPTTQTTINGLSLEDRSQHIEKHSEFYNLVLDVINMVSNSLSTFNEVDFLNQEETVDFTPLTEIINKTIIKLKQVIEYDTDPIKLSHEDESYLKRLVDSHTKLKEKLIQIKQDMENVKNQIQTILSEREMATASNNPIQSINRLYDTFEKVSESYNSTNSAFINTLNIFQVNISITFMQQDWEEQFNYSMSRVVIAICLCCLLSIILMILVLKSKRFSMKQFSDKDSS